MRFPHVTDLQRPLRALRHAYRVLNDPLNLCALINHDPEWDFNTEGPTVRCSRCPARYTGSKWRV